MKTKLEQGQLMTGVKYSHTKKYENKKDDKMLETLALHLWLVNLSLFLNFDKNCQCT